MADEEYHDIRNLARKVLAAVESEFEQARVDLPARRFTIVGEPAHDCEQVSVSFQQAYLGMPGQESPGPLRCPGPTSAVFSVEVARKVPEPTRTGPPSVDSIQAVADQQMDDASLLMRVGATFSEGFPFAGVVADVNPGDPSGGIQGVILNLTVGVGSA